MTTTMNNDAMMTQKSELVELFEACQDDDALKARLINDPSSVLAEFDIETPEGICVKVVENTDDTMYITIPAAPRSAKKLLDSDVLNRATGGGCCGYMTGGYTNSSVANTQFYSCGGGC